MAWNKVLAAAVVATLLPLAGAQDRGDQVVMARDSDAHMAAAIKEARRTLPEFLKLAANPPPDTEGYKLKVKIVDGKRVEHFWVIPFEVVKGGFSGTLANSPQIVRNVRGGQTIQFKEADISDWGYEKNGRQVGSYTVCALFQQMPPDQVMYYRDNHGFDC